MNQTECASTASIISTIDNSLILEKKLDFINQSAATIGAANIMTLVPASTRTAAWAGGSDAPEKPHLAIGFIPLTDCASVVMAHEWGFDKKYGLTITPSKEASWAAVRDKLVLGELDAAHILYSMMYSIHLGIGNQKKQMAILMGLNHNGQAITLSHQLRDKNATTGKSLKQLIAQRQRDYTFAQTFPTGTHAMWLYYWLAAHDINPITDIKTVVIPPAQMVSNMRAGYVDGFCAGEPWNARAIDEQIGFTVTTSQAIWANHPEKVLGTTKSFSEQYPNTTRALMCAVLDASRHLDTVSHRAEAAKTLADKRYINAPEEVIAGRMTGQYDNGLGTTWQDTDCIRFFADGEVNYPYCSHGMWFLTQFHRWGLLKQDVDYLAISQEIHQLELYGEVARSLGITIPDHPLKTETLFDGVVFNPAEAVHYANSFHIHA